MFEPSPGLLYSLGMTNSWNAVRVAYCLCMLAGVLLAQGETTGALVGSVTDPAGAAVAGATVTVLGAETSLKRSTTTDAAGRFNLPQ